MNLLEKIKCKLQGVSEVEDITSAKELKEDGNSQGLVSDELPSWIWNK